MKKKTVIKRQKNIDSIQLVLIICIVIFLLLFVIVAMKTYFNYKTFKSHRDYIRQPEISIKPWMTTHYVIDQFNISEENFYRILALNKTSTTDRSSINKLCKHRDLNCTIIVEALNDIRQT